MLVSEGFEPLGAVVFLLSMTYRQEESFEACGSYQLIIEKMDPFQQSLHNHLSHYFTPLPNILILHCKICIKSAKTLNELSVHLNKSQ